jgi:NADH-quinone oxidoreductase subunit L
MGGLAARMPVTYITFLIGGLSLAGFPFVTAGFWSKDEILADALAHNHTTVLVVLLLAAFLTAFYTMRQIALTFWGAPRTESAAHAHESAWTMTLPLVVLAFFAVTAGYVGVHHEFPVLGHLLGENPFEHFLMGALPVELDGFSFKWTPVLLSVLVGLGGLLAGWLVYGRRPLGVGDADPVQAALGPVHTLLGNKYYLDEFYQAAFIAPAKWVSTVFVSRIVDRGMIDGLLHSLARLMLGIGSGTVLIEKWGVNYVPDQLADGVQATGNGSRFVQTGQVQTYLLGVVVAVLAMTAALLMAAR